MIFSKNDIQKIRDALLDVDENSLTETSANILPVKLLLLDLHEMMSLIAEKINNSEDQRDKGNTSCNNGNNKSGSANLD